MTWGEAIRLTRELGRDTSSHMHAALADWEYPASREALVAMEHYDAYARRNFKRPLPYPRPWPDRSKATYGKGTAIPVDDLRSVLDRHRAAVEAERAGGRPRDARGRFVARQVAAR